MKANVGLHKLAKSATGISLAAASGALPHAAMAAPFTFEFVTPRWDNTDNAAFYGTNLDLHITVDNDAATDLSQAQRSPFSLRADCPGKNSAGDS
jgi:hypothetical protein